MDQGQLAGKRCLITGATAGIGLITARELALRGADLVLVGRSEEKCREVVRALEERFGRQGFEALVADLSSQSEVRRLARVFKSRHDRLDILINNVGALFADYRESVDGIELTFALNHLAPFLLTNLLLDELRAADRARVIVVASDAHRGGAPRFLQDFQAEKGYRGFRAYCDSKLANVLFANELARRLDGTGVAVNSLHPGFVNTSFFNGNGRLGWFMRRFAGLFALSPEQGAQTSIHLASSPEVNGITGRYFVKQKPVQPSRMATDPAVARSLWELSETLTQLKLDPEKSAQDN